MANKRKDKILDMEKPNGDIASYFDITTCGGVSVLSIFNEHRGQFVEMSRHVSVLEAEDARDAFIDHLKSYP